MHDAARQYVADAVAKYGPFRRMLELGSRDVNGSARDLFDHPEQLYLGLDVLPGPGVDVVADAAEFCDPHRSDAVVCCEVLEHTLLASRIVNQAARTLKRGGVFIRTTAVRIGQI